MSEHIEWVFGRAFDKIAEGLKEAIAIARGQTKAPRMFVPPELDQLAALTSEIERLRQEAANYKFALFSAVENVHKPQMAGLIAEIERLRAALLPCADWLQYAYRHIDSVTANAVKAHLPVIRAVLEQRDEGEWPLCIHGLPRNLCGQCSIHLEVK